MDNNIYDLIAERKNLSLVNKPDNLFVFKQNSSNNLYHSIIGFIHIEDNIDNWKELEGLFINICEEYHKKNSNAYIEPYLIFLIDESNYMKNLETIVIIEKDEFYCRKFVHKFNIDNIDKLIAKLPFGDSLFDIKRDNFLPASKILQNYGIEKELIQKLESKKLVNQEELLNLFSMSKLRSNEEKYVFNENRIENYVSIKSMEIEEFRIYGENQKFNLDADLIVLYGSNGLGKTSFFDAFEYGVTGNINRLVAGKDTFKNFSSSKNTIPKVKLEFLVNSSDILYIERELKDLKAESGKIKFNNVEHTMHIKTLFNLLTQKNITLNKPELIKLFRATHLSNQDESELTIKALNSSSSLSNNLLSKMISFEDYINFESNLEKLMDLCKDKSKKIIIEKEDLEDKVKSILKKLSENKEILNNKENSTTLKLFEQDLLARTKKYFNKKESIQLNEELLSMVELEIQTCLNKILNFENAKKIKSEMAEIENKRIKDISTIINKLELDKKNLEGKELELSKLSEKEVEWNDLINTKREDIMDLIEAKTSLYDLIILRPELLQSQLKIDDYKKTNEKKQVDKEKCNNDISNLLIEINKSTNDLNNLNRKKENLSNLVIEYELFSNFPEEILSFEKEISKYNEMINEDEVLLKENNDTEFLLEAEKNTIFRKIEITKESNSELDSLISSIKKYIKNNICPVCSSSHESVGDLMEKIDSKLSNLSNEYKYEEENYEKIKKKILTLNTNKHDLNSKIKQFKLRIQDLIEKKEEKLSRLNNFKQKLSSLGLNYDEFNKEKINMDRSELEISINEIEKMFLDKRDKKSDLETLIKNLEREINGNKDEIKKLEVFISEKSEIFIKKEKRVNNLLDYFESTYNLKINRENIEENKKIMDDLSAKLNIDLGNLKEKFITDSKIFKKLSGVVKELRDNISQAEIRQKLNSENDNKIESLSNELYHLNISENFEEILEKIAEYRTRVQEYSILKTDVLNYLNLIDFEKKSIEIKGFEQEINKFSNEINLLDEQLNKIKITNEKLVEVKEILKDARNEIMDNYCKNIEPLISIIQNRLRAIYGFSDFTLKLNEINDEVIISNNYYLSSEKNNLKPAHYLSEAQKNILRLSLFLSTTLSQNWSGLKTIFLDDPIQHFDDLNSYAFLDIIKSLILPDNDTDKKQIIISTCDYRFFKLIQEKFRPLKNQNKVIYYKFDSLSKNGPIIKEL